MERQDDVFKGKGYALRHACERIPLKEYDALLIIDADTYVDENILVELSKSLSRGDLAIQCYIQIPNRNESWFTELLSVSRVINGLFYHYPKSAMGLSSYLMGSGICFSTAVIAEKGWTAFSIAEDWEYYAQLLLDGHRIAFCKEAIVHQFESKSLGQATSQRLRWSSGRWKITKTLGLQLMMEGIKKRNLVLFDGSLPLIFPNLSLQINLSLVTLALALLSPLPAGKPLLEISALGLLLAQALLFVAGAFAAGSPFRTACAALYAPLFLTWKLVIDLMCFTGLYRNKRWIRTRRHQAQL
jgi:cellulose synthase/poly-beta-1,6-N-acetylglucosamine synthase-like glycosyltransferase